VTGWRIGVDIGGTFTDLVAVAPDGSIGVFKVLSVPADPGAGVLAALECAAESIDLPVSGFLAATALFAHGSTIATNTVLEGKGARVGCLTSTGFRDSLEIRRGIRDNPWEHRIRTHRCSRHAPCAGRCADASTLTAANSKCSTSPTSRTLPAASAPTGSKRSPSVCSTAMSMIVTSRPPPRRSRGIGTADGSPCRRGWRRSWASTNGHRRP
jgi:hypothetical protein